MAVDPSPRDVPDPRQHHAAIAGTGRAGTSFLVRFLGKCGLDVGDSDLLYDDRARAGLEHHLMSEGAPYVVKDPWLFAYCDAIDPERIVIDALIVPIRELMAAATSRLLQDRISMAEREFGEWPASDVNGVVIGGAVYSLDPVDEARILAVGFHRLIHWATARQIPLYLLEFPRAVDDSDYLIDTLWPWLSGHCDRTRAQSAFASVADPELVRVKERDDGGFAGSESRHAAALDREAMAILVKERDFKLARVEEQLEETSMALASTEQELAESRTATADTEHRLDETRVVLGNAQSQLELSNAQLRQRNAELGEVQAQLSARSADIEALRRTLSWRITKPLRRLRKGPKRHSAEA